MTTARHVIVMGVSGCGKSSVGKAIAERLGWRFIEGDEHHPAANIRKMSEGTPLTDEDRWPWLDALHRELVGASNRGESVVLSCSALRQIYRDRLSAGLSGIRWVYLRGDREALLRNLVNRSGHFMKAGMLDSQLRTLEEPVDALVLPVNGPIDRIADEATRRIRET